MKALHSLLFLLALGIGSLGLAGQAHAQGPSGGGKDQGSTGSQQQKANDRRAARADDILAQLNLSADQQKQIQDVRQKFDAQRQSAGGQRPTRADMQKLRQQENEEISKVLTPEQRTKWEQLKAQRAASGAHHSGGAHRKGEKANSATSSGGSTTNAGH